MESFFRETLKQYIPQPGEYEINVESCTCIQSLGEVAYGRRNISLFRIGCERPDQIKSEISGFVHTCICRLDGNLTFSCLLEACRACHHHCICGSAVIPNEEQGAAQAGHRMCKADRHKCLCKSHGSQMCIAAEQHKCSCAVNPATCRLNRDEIPRDRNHVCRCGDTWYQNVKCRVHS